jgi:hypothetical protein
MTPRCREQHHASRTQHLHPTVRTNRRAARRYLCHERDGTLVVTLLLVWNANKAGAWDEPDYDDAVA